MTFQERNIINGVASTTILALTNMYEKLIPFVLLSLILIVVDSRFGIAAARHRGEVIRISRMWRRAINKLVDYICWITLAGIFGHAYGDILGIPILAAIMLLIVYAIEISSCFNNYFESKGIKKRVNFLKILRPDISEAVEDAPEKPDNKQENENHE